MPTGYMIGVEGELIPVELPQPPSEEEKSEEQDNKED